jgi:hypothetical protein
MADPKQRNDDVRWDNLPSDDYYSHNYENLTDEDRAIIGTVSAFLVRELGGQPRVARAIDVGAGTNLYPALLMLPWANHLTLLDYSRSNVRWLRERIAADTQPWAWQPFWDEMRELEGYNRVTDPRKELHVACAGPDGQPAVEQGSVFGLAEQPRRWELGTMFFVAESITRVPAEFRAAIGAFLAVLKPGAPFAAAFMENSTGWTVSGTDYPAVQVTAPDVEAGLAAFGATGLEVGRVDEKAAVRPGYTGMIVATGRAGDQ